MDWNIEMDCDYWESLKSMVKGPRVLGGSWGREGGVGSLSAFRCWVQPITWPGFIRQSKQGMAFASFAHIWSENKQWKVCKYTHQTCHWRSRCENTGSNGMIMTCGFCPTSREDPEIIQRLGGNREDGKEMLLPGSTKPAWSNPGTDENFKYISSSNANKSYILRWDSVRASHFTNSVWPISFKGFSGGSVVVCLQCRGHRRRSFDPWVRKIPWSRAW